VVPGKWLSAKILGRIPGAFRKVIIPSGMSCVGLQTQFIHLQMFLSILKMAERIVIVVERGDELRYWPRTLSQREKDTHTLMSHEPIYISFLVYLTPSHILFKLTIYQPNVDEHSVLITCC